jgi:hypothetical protein
MAEALWIANSCLEFTNPTAAAVPARNYGPAAERKKSSPQIVSGKVSDGDFTRNRDPVGFLCCSRYFSLKWALGNLQQSVNQNTAFFVELKVR